MIVKLVTVSVVVHSPELTAESQHRKKNIRQKNKGKHCEDRDVCAVSTVAVILSSEQCFSHFLLQEC